MSVDIDLTPPGAKLEVSVCASGGMIRFFVRTGAGDHNLHMSAPAPREALVALKQLLDVHLDSEPDATDQPGS